jgi:hypothetical protein
VVETVQDSPGKSISERLEEVMAQLSYDQLRFLAAMADCSTKAEAAEAIGLKPNTVYKWPDIVDEALELQAAERVETARAIARKYLTKAMMVKVKALDSPDEGVRQRAATELIEWQLGKAAQTNLNENTGEVVVRVVRDSNRAVRA